MKIIRVKDYEALSKRAASYLIEKVRNKPNMILGLATGGTSEGTYQYLIKDYKGNQTSYRDVTTFNLDEYIGLDGNNENSYRFFMDTHLFNHLDIEKTKTHVPRGNVKDPLKECDTYELLIKERGGIDLQLLGIGGNGHIGFNEPGSSFQSRTRIVELADSTRRDNARFFEQLEDVPTHAITMGIATIMESKEILLIASGEGKREAMRRLLQGDVSEDFPASILKKHSHVTIIADEAALTGLE
ncbi:glucosamine-6-phosphate deaminase [Cytobacillus solani]|uniref:glucosamine-6-phosphate deaminase n=1 Tax=Cytobacillus solani TaxID=1637975 RepID=UPI0006ABB6A5|nr:glucosamine-6-phosphate deaminase [Cytobacillus solani]KOP71241.1 glucosamine-6-phosphate deaminase [Bacillus sp. FJAT-21945]USK55630.1 glucosamine-6-phosphate deaminase [Cytobacillus solani]